MAAEQKIKNRNFEEAMSCKEKGKYVKAAEYFEKAYHDGDGYKLKAENELEDLLKNKTSYEDLCEIGEMYFYKDDSYAQKWFEEAIKIKKEKSGKASRFLGIIEEKNGNYVKAAELFEEAYERNYKEAQKDLNHLLNTGDYETLCAIGEMYFRKHNNNYSREWFEEAVKIEKERNGKAYLFLCEIEKKKGDVKKAAECLYKASLDNFYESEATEKLQELVKSTEIFKDLINFCLEKDDAKFFKFLLLKINKISQYEWFGEANGKIEKLLKYRPGSKERYIRTYICDEPTNQGIRDLFDDYGNTSSATSSDDITDRFQYVQKDFVAPRKKHILFRGVAFNKNYFSSRKRKTARSVEFHDQAVYSLATQDLAKKFGDDFEKADQIIKGYFTLLKLTEDKPEFNEKYRKAPPRKKNGEDAKFSSLYEHFVQAYVTTYGRLFASDEKGMWRNFNFYSSENPIVSTSIACKSASNFATGHFIKPEERYFPKIRYSTGKLKHRRLGYVQVYCVDDDFYHEHATRINEMIEGEVIGVDHHHRHASEVIVESSLPRKYVIGFQLFSLPSMHEDWSSNIKEKYGLNRQKYQEFKDGLKDAKSRERMKEILKEMIVIVTEHQADRLEKSVEGYLNKRLDTANSLSRRKHSDSDTSRDASESYKERERKRRSSSREAKAPASLARHSSFSYGSNDEKKSPHLSNSSFIKK